VFAAGVVTQCDSFIWQWICLCNYRNCRCNVWFIKN